MKKFLAGALAAALVLSNSVPAFASGTKTVKKSGSEVEYEVPVTNPKVVLNIMLPAQIKAALNPGSADFELGDQTLIYTNNGIVSVAYPIYNLDTDYGVFFGVTAVTTTSSSKWAVTRKTLTPGVKNANMAFVASDTEEGVAVYSNVSKAATAADSQGCLVLDSTVAANKAKGTVKGQTSQQKVAYLPAAADEETPSKIYVGFAGALADDSATVYVNWTSDDTINVNLVLKITPAPKNLGAIPDP